MLTPNTLTCEYLTNPIGLDARQPRLSWKSASAERGARQTAYQIVVTDSSAALDAATDAAWVRDSGKVASDASLHVPYAGPALHPGQRCYWRVRVWDEHNNASAWSETAFWEMGLLDSSHWHADWITPDWDEDTRTPQPAPMLRRTFKINGAVATARIYATCLGLYQLRLNGRRVGDAELTPGWTSYDHRIQYQTYDVTDLLHDGDNAIGALLGDGWYRGYMGFAGQRNNYGDRLALLMQLHITYADGRTEIIGSDAAWRASRGPIVMSDIYMGETYDARLEKPGWDQPGYDDRDWQGVRTLDRAKQEVVAQDGVPVKRQGEIRPTRIFKTPKGETVLDFAQNMVGWVKLRVRGPAGTTITIRHAEVLDQDGNFYTDNLRAATQFTTYTLQGTPDADEVFEPHFTFQGFQYIAVEGFPGEPTLDHFIGVVVHSETPPTGTFECSNPMINQLQRNIVWGQKGNFVDVPTDCPQRDERLGWTGDTQVFIRTACFNMNVAAFFTKWLRDLAADQRPDGAIAFVVPDVMSRGNSGMGAFAGAGAAAWSDAGIICPWTLYLCYGDRRLLEEQYDSMAAWVKYMRDHADDDFIWRKGFQFGDWLDFRGRGALIPSPVTNSELIATAFFAYGADQMATVAQILGKADDAQTYAELARKVKAAFVDEFVAASGRVGPNSQTAYVLALHFNLLPEDLRPKAAARLADEVRKAGYHLTTGFVGTPYLCHVLSRFGHLDVAYELLNQESFPSWLYPVKMGATTIWERWDGIKPDGSFQDAGMNSFNHYAYGAIGEWLYRTVAGIDVDAVKPGYKHVLIQPQPGGGLTRVRATLNSPYGLVVSEWELTASDFRLRVTVPPNASATVRLPATSLEQVTESGNATALREGIFSARIDGPLALIEVGAGTYQFVTTGLNLTRAMAGVKHIAGRLDLHSTLRDLIAHDASRAALGQHLDLALLEGPLGGMVKDTSPAQLAEFMPHLLPYEKLKLIEAALAVQAP